MELTWIEERSENWIRYGTMMVTYFSVMGVATSQPRHGAVTVMALRKKTAQSLVYLDPAPL